MAKESVILLHGIHCTSKAMKRMARFFEAAGYAVLNLDYPSTQKTIGQSVEHLMPQIIDAMQTSDRVHFVGYSMGGLVIRKFLNHITPEMPNKLGRVVMLGTPNHGSEAADFFWNQSKLRALFRWIFGPAGKELGLKELDKALELQPIAHGEVGIIAGTRKELLFSHGLTGPNDGKVRVESTYLPEMKDHLKVPFSHKELPHKQRVWTETLNFIATGEFKGKAL